MINTTTKQHYEQMLGLTTPWVVSDINLDIENLNLTIKITTPRRVKLPCPVCNKLCSKEDHLEERSWKHLDAMQFETIIKCATPLTYLFERFSIDVLKSAKNIKSAKKLLRLSWDQVQHIQARAVERGMAKRKDEP